MQQQSGQLVRTVLCLVLGATLTATPASAVVGGKPALEGQFPAVGALMDARMPGYVLCTGTLVAPQIVLTAGHCLLGRAPGVLRFTTSENAGHPSASETYEIAHTVVHRDLDMRATGATPMNDLGVAWLTTAVRGVAPETLSTASTPLPPARGVLVGYGPTERATAARTDAPVRSVGATSLTARSTLEAYAGGADEPQGCHGDSGGSVFVDDGAGHRRLWGIISRARDEHDDECRRGTVVTRVDAYLPWLRESAGL